MTYLFYIVNIIAVDDLVTQGARASATMIFIMLNRINSAPARKGLMYHYQLGINPLAIHTYIQQFGIKYD